MNDLSPRTEIRALTGLRGLAALYVVFYHAAAPQGSGPWHDFVRHGYIAVDLFFILSGFVMALTYGPGFQGKTMNAAAYLSFLGKRIARVYPLYLLITLATFVVFALNLSHDKLSDHPAYQLFCNLVMVQSWGLSQSIVGPAWSISTEWAAYLLFPPFVAITLMRSRYVAWATLIGAVIVLVVIARYYAHLTGYVSPVATRLDAGQDATNSGALALLRCFAGFVLGLLAFRWQDGLARDITVPLSLIALALLFIPATDVALALVFFVLIPNLARSSGPVARFLGWQPVFMLGVWSYSIYLLHARFNLVKVGATKVFGRMGMPFAHDAAVLVMVAAVVVASALTYRFVEKPARELTRNLLTIRRGRPMSREPSAP